MSYVEQVQALGQSSEDDAQSIFDRWSDGELTFDEAVALLAALVAAANSRAAALADLGLAATIMHQIGEPVATLGLTAPADDVERLTKASRTLLSLDNVTPERVRRLARCEPLDTAAKAWSDGVAQSRYVDGWVRQTHGSCQLCAWWARGGQVWAADHPMPRHKGCTCSQIPTRKEITHDRYRR